jgi:hypothetical protein
VSASLFTPRVGIDFSFASPLPTPAELKAAGVTFVCRYLSQDPAKDLTASEYSGYRTNGIDVVVVWETAADRMLAGHSAGASDAAEARALVTQIGIPGAPPIYFACDFDATPGDQTPINAYLNGVAAEIALERIGMYGGFWPLSRAFDARLITFGWQTFAWSGGNWDSRAQLRQVQNGVTVAGVDADIDHALADNFGQVTFKPPVVTISISGTQEGWRHCDKCQGSYWGPGIAASVCPAGGTHATKPGEYNYVFAWKLP